MKSYYRYIANADQLPSARMYDFLLQHYVRADPQVTIADVGCENGHGIRLIRDQKPSSKVVAIDKRDQRSDKSGEFMIADLSQPLQTTVPQFDYVFCLEVFEHIEKRYEEQVLSNLRRFLHPTARLFLSTPIKRFWNVLHLSTRDHVNEVEYPYFSELLRKHFRIEESFVLRKRSRSYYLRHENTPANALSVGMYNFPSILVNRLQRLGLLPKAIALEYFDRQTRIVRDPEGVGTVQLYVLGPKDT